MTKVIDMTGQRFGSLIVLERGENSKNGGARWWCQCDCGSPKKLIDGAALRRGLVISCGCYREKKLHIQFQMQCRSKAICGVLFSS